jgi:hypothetical protein
MAIAFKKLFKDTDYLLQQKAFFPGPILACCTDLGLFGLTKKSSGGS